MGAGEGEVLCLTPYSSMTCSWCPRRLDFSFEVDLFKLTLLSSLFWNTFPFDSPFKLKKLFAFRDPLDTWEGLIEDRFLFRKMLFCRKFCSPELREEFFWWGDWIGSEGFRLEAFGGALGNDTGPDLPGG